MKVLIVDGSKERRRDTVEVLAQLTNVVIQGAVANVRTALHALAAAQPDLVVADAMLPDGDGAELVHRIRRLERSPSIVVVSTEPSDEQRDRYLAAGVDRYVARDTDLRSLQDAVVLLGRTRSSVAMNDTLRVLGRLASGVAHDVNNYLTAVEGLVTLLQRSPQDAGLWQQMRQALDMIARINGTMLEYARGVVPAPSAQDLGSIVRNVLQLAARVIPSGIRVTADIAEGLRSVRGVQSELEQLVLNLVINACDAMPDGGALHVAVTRTGSAAVHLRIADSGPGAQQHADLGTPRGLGLGIVHAVVERHQGAVQFSARPGGGTVVDVILPAS